MNKASKLFLSVLIITACSLITVGAIVGVVSLNRSLAVPNLIYAEYGFAVMCLIADALAVSGTVYYFKNKQ